MTRKPADFRETAKQDTDERQPTAEPASGLQPGSERDTARSHADDGHRERTAIGSAAANSDWPNWT
jgi:hypothetical protein